MPHAGFKAYFTLDNAAGSPQNLSSYADDFEFPWDIEQLDVTTFKAAGTNSKDFIPGLTGGGQVSHSGPLDTTMYSHFTGIYAAQNAGTAGFTLEYAPAGSASGRPKITCEVYLATFTPSTSVSGRVEYSVSLQQTGAATFATY